MTQVLRRGRTGDQVLDGEVGDVSSSGLAESRKMRSRAARSRERFAFLPEGETDEYSERVVVDRLSFPLRPSCPLLFYL